MDGDNLGPLELQLKSGKETFTSDGAPLDFDVLEFWRWSTSDLVDNTTRGVLAEFIVAKALGIDTTLPREGWATWDLNWRVAPDTTLAIEVKSAAYLQSWGQKRLSTIQFVVPRRRGFDAVANELEQSASRHAHVYVFCLLAHQDKTTIEPTDLDQWRFWAVPTKHLDDRQRSQHSITLNSLITLAGEPVTFGELTAKVRRAGHEHLGVSD